MERKLFCCDGWWMTQSSLRRPNGREWIYVWWSSEKLFIFYDQFGLLILLKKDWCHSQPRVSIIVHRLNRSDRSIWDGVTAAKDNKIHNDFWILVLERDWIKSVLMWGMSNCVIAAGEILIDIFLLYIYVSESLWWNGGDVRALHFSYRHLNSCRC